MDLQVFKWAAALVTLGMADLEARRFALIKLVI